METLVTGMWAGRRVFVTGHTGFKGSWLSLWLTEAGCEVTGYALPPPTVPSLFEVAGLAGRVKHQVGDVRNIDALNAAITQARPEVVFHLAAQPLVRKSYDEPVETYATNVMGTVHLLEAVRQVGGVRAVVCVTSDKCYQNNEWVWPYRESDPMGGHDPYSSSKGCAELVTAAYRQSFFSPERYDEHQTALASVRAGNVIGGGDWACDRLVPDLIRAFESGRAPEIRSPGAVRPWQHVLEAIHGYVLIAERLFDGDLRFADGWNFGPADDDARPVAWIVDEMAAIWGAKSWVRDRREHPHEAGLLRLDCSKARVALGWRPLLTLANTLKSIVDWHKAIDQGGDPAEVTLRQIRDYRALARPTLESAA